MSTGLVYDQRFLQHEPGPAHPERPDRLQAIIDRLQNNHLWDRLAHIPATPAPLAAIEALHDAQYVQRVRAACEAGESFIDCEDSGICPLSYDAAVLAVGGVLGAVDAVMNQRSGLGREIRPSGVRGQVSGKDGKTAVRNAFCAVRPPGHHAERGKSMGFCLFNNVALAAQHLVVQYGFERVAIVDFDVHHGNGTQHMFEERSDVLFISLHEHPAYQYPGTGFAWEKGKGAGEGFTINIPLQPQAGDREYRHAFLDSVLPALDRYRPQFLLLSAGFDASEHDPMGHMRVTAEGFGWMTRQLKAASERHCGGRLVSVLEGGYDLRSLGECVALHLGILLQPEGHDDLMALKAGL
jgi:acetoin utilization deacetylase AcuC-like enzyme